MGKWITDFDYNTSEYLHKGSELQKIWCGYGWTESEIERRIKYIKDIVESGAFVSYEIEPAGRDSVKVKIKNETGEDKEKIWFGFRRMDNEMFSCEQSPKSDTPIVFKIEQNYLLIIIKITPEMMNCKLISKIPTEAWLPVLSFKKME
ncbi:MAG: hypothetical protein A2V93_02670 [Ignavibacteria bacterium RBG_16_34_14]|nr:MAG: hypothetical protein A2V93_02670 [Ignavibacteria bacterium RBG_16_34_14]